MGGLACVVIVGTVLSVKGTSAGTDTAGIIETPQRVRGLEIVAKDGEIRVTHGAATSVVVVKNDSTGDLLQKFSLDGKNLDSVLTNDRDTSVLVSIQSESQSALVALPGTKRAEVTSGEGSFKDLARAISDSSGEAVRLEAKDANARLAWKLDTTDLSQSKATLGSFTVERRNGLLYLTD